MAEHPLVRRVDVWLPIVWILGLPSFVLLASRTLPDIHVFKPDRVAFLVAALPLLALAARHRDRLQRPGLVEASMLAVVFVLVASWATTMSGKPIVVLKQDADFLLTCVVMPFAAFLMGRNAEWTDERLRRALWVLIGALAVYFLLYGLIQATLDWNFLVAASIKQHPDRARGPFDNAAPFGLIVAMLAVLTLLLFLEARRRPARLSSPPAALGLAQALVASKTRAAWLALPVGLLLPFARFRRIRWLAVSLVVVVAVQVFAVPALQVSRLHVTARPPQSQNEASRAADDSTGRGDYLGLQERLVEEDPLYDRAAVTRIAMHMIRTHPLFGLGFGLWTFESHKAEYFDDLHAEAGYAVYPNNAHNDVLNVLVLVGAVGAAVYALLAFAIARVLWRRYHDAPSALTRNLAVFVASIFVILFAGAQFHSVMAMAYVQVLSFYLLGIVAHERPDVVPQRARVA